MTCPTGEEQALVCRLAHCAQQRASLLRSQRVPKAAAWLSLLLNIFVVSTRITPYWPLSALCVVPPRWSHVRTS